MYDRSNTQVRSFTYDINTGAGWWRTVTRADRKSVTLRQRRAGDRTAKPGRLKLHDQYEKDHITITDSLDRREVLTRRAKPG